MNRDGVGVWGRRVGGGGRSPIVVLWFVGGGKGQSRKPPSP